MIIEQFWVKRTTSLRATTTDYELVPSTTRIKSKAWPRLLSWTWHFKTNAEAYALNTLVALKEEDSFDDVIFHLRPQVGQEDLHSWEQPLHRNLRGWKRCKVSTESEPVIFKRFRFRIPDYWLMVCWKVYLMAFSGTTQVSRYQKGKTNLDFTEARGSE